jgi:hypothetical protein
METQNRGEIIIYKAEDGQTAIDVRLEQETVWLTQTQIVALFKSSKANISEHIKSIFTMGELKRASTVRKFRTVQTEGQRTITRTLEHYAESRPAEKEILVQVVANLINKKNM